ncbi:MAG: hypothetical protein ABW022_20250 [Actinoplanes sp.]
MRGAPRHTPPTHTQPQPPDNTSDHIDGQIIRWTQTGQLIHHETAREIAAWWSASLLGDPFAAFASTGTIIDDLGPEILIAPTNDRSDRAALAALLAYVDAVTVTVWVVGHNTVGYLPENDPFAFTLDYQDARTDYITYLEGAPDTLGYDTCACFIVDEDDELCDMCEMQAEVAAFIRDDLPAKGSASLWLRPTDEPIPINFWLDSRELTYADFRQEQEYARG